MALSRRDLISTGLGLAAEGSAMFGRRAAAQQTLPRLRLEVFVQDTPRVAALKRGVAVMKQRRPSDPTSWFFQGAVHAVSDDAIAEAASSDPGVSQLDRTRFWNQCPHFGQSSADFLPWHRAYLHYFERILRAAAGDPTLSLPYWNYGEVQQRGFPQIFADPEPSPQTGQPTNPLYDERREQAFMAGLYTLSDGAVSARSAFGQVAFFGRSEVEGFAGGVSDDNSRTRGQIERSPHDLIHFAIGGWIPGTLPGEGTGGLMSNVQTAAFDPIFWVHHANIDRLWTAWEAEAGRVWGQVPPSEWLSDPAWAFHDQDGSVQEHQRAYYLRRSNLGTRYDTDVSGNVPLSEREPLDATRVGPRVADGSPPAESAGTQSLRVREEAGAAREAFVVGPDAPARRSVAITELPPGGPQSLGAILRSTQGGVGSRRIFVELLGIEHPAVPSVGYDVYVNLPPGTVPNRDLPAYLGPVALFGIAGVASHGAHAGHSGSEAQIFDATDAIAAAGNGQNLLVDIVPFELFQRPPRSGGSRRAEELRIGGIRVMVRELAPGNN
ncbi:tyrosinase family protein [Roseomonas sp. 18066]|uniref:tyrosinase family protein n=1 Tax=Roseomonas sp. 18066 TaxID=2681412 RepID=UPI00135CABD8|nr:tyrosinase family protein [Roseomonas sp. 18066]